MGYVFLYIHRPFEVWTVLGDVRIELLYMLFTGAVWLAHPKKRLELDPLTLAAGGLVLAVVLCSILSPHSERCFLAVESWLKLMVFFLVLVTTVQTEEDLRKIVLTFLVVMTGYMLHSLLEFMNGRYVYRMGINRMLGIDSTSDSNSFAMSIVLSLVFVPVLWRTSTAPRMRPFLLGYMGLSALCVALTGSRGAFVALLVWAGIVVWNSAWRSRLLALAIPAAPVLFMLLPPSLQSRFETIVNPAAGPKNAQESSQGRIDGFLVGMQLWQDNPAVGVGPGAWRKATGRLLESHNLYGQVAGELGTLGVLAMLGVVAGYVANIRAIRGACPTWPEAPPDFLRLLAGAVGTALLLLLLGGLIGHNLFRPHWMIYAGFLIIARRCALERAAAYAYWPPDEQYEYEPEFAGATGY